MSNLIQIDTPAPAALRDVKSKKDIEALALSVVAQEIEEGFINPIEELVMSTKGVAYLAARTDALRAHALNEMKEMKEVGVLGAKVQKSTTPGRWAYDDEYLSRLKDEAKTVESKAQKKEKKDRLHITLEGEEIFIEPATKTEGGETVKVLL
jgi:hypothetical protein